MKFSPSSNPSHLDAITRATPSGLVFKPDEQIVESLQTLPKETDFNEVDGDFNTLLYLAAANNHDKTVSYLLTERKVDTNVKVNENLTAAHIAAANGHTGILEMLVKCEEIRLSEKDKYGETPLFRAIGNAPVDKLLATVSLLISADPTSIEVVNEDNTSPIELALQRQHPSVIKLLLDNGAKVSEQCSHQAVTMMMARSTPSSQFGGAFVFYTGTQANDNLRQSAKLIIETYNKQHPPENLNKITDNSISNF
jgi:uncharacterized protein